MACSHSVFVCVMIQRFSRAGRVKSAHYPLSQQEPVLEVSRSAKIRVAQESEAINTLAMTLLYAEGVGTGLLLRTRIFIVAVLVLLALETQLCSGIEHAEVDGGGAGVPTTGPDLSPGVAGSAGEVIVGVDGTVSLPDTDAQKDEEEEQQQQQLPIFPHLGLKVAPNHNFASIIHRKPRPGELPYAEYKTGDSPYNYKTPIVREQSDDLARSRRIHVKNAMKHAWDGYKQYAWGYDELLPVSQRGRNNWGGLGTTLVDSMSTLWLLNMTDEFSEAVGLGTRFLIT